jgi:LPS-assembly lipoprotein
MSSPDRSRTCIGRLAAAGALLALALLASACTVRPLYSNADATDGAVTGSTAGLYSIAVTPPDTRVAQEVSNHLIFLFNGGAGQPAGARYTLYPGVFVVDLPSALVQVDTEDRPTAGTMRMISAYTLKENATGKTVAKGRREISAAYDRPRQEFAAVRAKRDAENRAARELAELVSLDIGQKLQTQQ